MSKAKLADSSISDFTPNQCRRCGDKVPSYREKFCTQKCRQIWKNPSPYSRA